MAGVEEAASFGSHLNGDLDPDDREEGTSSTAEEAAKKKRRKKKKGKGAVSGKGVMFFAVPARKGRTTWLGPGTGDRGAGIPEPWPSLIPRPDRMARPASRAAAAPRGRGRVSREDESAPFPRASTGGGGVTDAHSAPTQTVPRT